MSEKRFTYDKPLVAFSKGGINDNVTGETYEFTMDTVLDLLNELSDENEKLKLKIVSLENEVQRQKNEIKNIRKEFTKKTEELNWLKSEDYLKKIY